MPLPFSTFTGLLSGLEKIETRDPPLLPNGKVTALRAETERWFNCHRHAVNGLGIKSAVALLSSLLPEKRTDRVYGIQTPSLCRILCRSLGLSASRAGDLQAYKRSGRSDLGQCLQRVLKDGGPPARPAVTLEEVDEMLEALAAQCRFSDQSITVSFPLGSSENRDKLLGDIFKRVTPVEGKWLVRLILKDFAPVRVHEGLVLRLFHFLLPDLLRFQDRFSTALRLLKDDPILRQLPERPDPRSEHLFRHTAASAIRPSVGVKVGRPTFLKARSIDNCMHLLGSQRWVLERKYDGEYCETHIDMGKSDRLAECIQIFSKSGKDSTADRKALHQTLVDCLRLGRDNCKIRKRAIILGELVVYSDETKSVLPFDKIRKHVSRSGVFLGNEQDSQASPHEHLAIVFFDLLLLDDEVVMSKPVDERRRWLREVYRKIPGRAMGAEWKPVDFADSGRARKLLLEQFAASIAQRCEGLILKPCGVPYFSLDAEPSELRRCFIKLKKDYIAGMGDEADFVVIGASYNAQQALRSGFRGVKWTDFHLGCLMNAKEVQRFDAKPEYSVVGTIQQEACIPKPILQTLNTLGTHLARPYSEAQNLFTLQGANGRIDVLFSTPFVLEVLGSGFDKPPNCGFYMLRHARVTKLHQDRSWKDCISFHALQEQAVAARSAPLTAEGELAETRVWITRIEDRLKRRLEREGTVTPRSRRGTPSTARTAELQGTTLVGGCSSGAKRPSPRDGETPCPAAKKRYQSDSTSVHNAAISPLVNDLSLQPRTKALTDITNQALGRDVNAGNARPSTKPATAGQCCEGRPAQVGNAACSGTRCPFSNSAVFLAPCIANALYITEDLLPTHETTITRDINHWDRNSFLHPPLSDTVSESQACEGMCKIVLVESKRLGAVKHVVEQITALNHGRLRERVEVYDWRVLEQCARHDRAADGLKWYFIGATMFVEAEERGIFVSTIPGIGHS